MLGVLLCITERPSQQALKRRASQATEAFMQRYSTRGSARAAQILARHSGPACFRKPISVRIGIPGVARP